MIKKYIQKIVDARIKELKVALENKINDYFYEQDRSQNQHNTRVREYLKERNDIIRGFNEILKEIRDKK